MNIALLCVLVVVTSGNGSFLEARAPHKEEHRIFLRKLQASQHEERRDTKAATWNEILADALVNRMNIFSSNQQPESEPTVEKSSFWTDLVSQMLHLYKTLIYDKLYKRNKPTPNYYEDDVGKEKKKDIDNVERNVKDTDPKQPKGEVEIIEPRYHGKLCDNCAEESQIDAAAEIATTEMIGSICPDGLVSSEDGCVNPKSKFILSIPYQCPTGYKADWLGYCRPTL